MKTEDSYQCWKAERCKIPVPDGFAERVMAVVQGRSLGGKSGIHKGWRDDLWLPGRRSARAALLGGLVTLGLFRFVFIAAKLALP